jgi:hypothetical protein
VGGRPAARSIGVQLATPAAAHAAVNVINFSFFVTDDSQVRLMFSSFVVIEPEKIVGTFSFFRLGRFRAEVRNKESLNRLYSVRLGDELWPVKPLGESVEACGHCMKVWSVVVLGGGGVDGRHYW